MKYSALLDRLQNLINYTPSQADLCKILDMGRAAMSQRAQRDSQFTQEEIRKIEKIYAIRLRDVELPDELVALNFYPDVYLSAGYGVEVINENPEKIVIDSRLLVTDRGTKLNHELCEVVMISGNSMSPEYRHGDRVIIDRGDTELADGHIFAFRYKGQCYVKEINLLGNKIKCISINKEYDPFYIDENEDFVVFGRIIPRIRL
jgi:phage repressor protein C with HTH and peptisase S24 domain